MDILAVLSLASFWTAIAFFVVIGLVFFKGRSAVLGSAYERIKNITAEIAEGESLRAQAQKLLAKNEQKYRETMFLINEISEGTNTQIKTSLEDIANRTEETLKRIKHNNDLMLKKADLDMRESVKKHILDKAVASVSARIEKEFSNGVGDTLFKSSISDVTSLK